MKHEFIETVNISKFQTICQELEDTASLIGPSLAMVTGPAGRGKTEAARYYAVHGSAIYIPPMNTRTPAMVLREITFALGSLRPQYSEACLSIIGEEMAKSRRLIMIDEADLLDMKVLEMLRNCNERYLCPIVFIGEEKLKGKITACRRLDSRMRRRMEFAPISQQDIGFFFKRCLDLKPSTDVLAAIHKRSGGDWRPVLTAAIGIERAMKSSNLKEVTAEMVNVIIKNL
jgi:DNA transposition AAA+ family ATPase